MKKSLIACLSLLVLFVTGCNGVSTNNYRTSETGSASKVVHGTLISQRNVTITGNSGVGKLAGGAGGAVAGSAIGGSSRSNIIGAIGGAVAGGLVGNSIDKSVNTQKGIEYIIRLKDGSTISVTQANDQQLANGQKVLVIYGSTTRVILDETNTSK